jgi:hypothetical protein
MKRLIELSLAGAAILICGSIAASAQAQSSSLGDYARAVKKTRPATNSNVKSFDNDNLPGRGTVSVVGNTTDSGDDADKDKDKNKDGSGLKPADQKSDGQKTAEKPPKIDPGQSSEERKKAYDGWKSKLDEQRKKVEQLSKELETLQTEYRLQAAAYYADTADRVRGSKTMATDDAKFKQRVDEKKKEVDDANAKLTDLLDQAHRSGVPNSVTE